MLSGSRGRVGIVVNERLVNMPHEVAPKLHEALRDEIEWAWEDEPTQERRDHFRFDHYVFLSRVLVAELSGLFF